MARRAMTKQQRAEALKQLKAGDEVSSVADALGVDAASVSNEKRLKVRQSEATTTYGSAVAVRLSPEELRQLDGLKSILGTDSRSDVLRSLLRASVGMLEFPSEQAEQLDQIRRELHKIGVNVNQIAYAANARKISLAKPHLRALEELRTSLPKVRTYLQSVVSEQRRRGVRLFQTFVEAQK